MIEIEFTPFRLKAFMHIFLQLRDPLGMQGVGRNLVQGGLSRGFLREPSTIFPSNKHPQNLLIVARRDAEGSSSSMRIGADAESEAPSGVKGDSVELRSRPAWTVHVGRITVENAPLARSPVIGCWPVRKMRSSRSLRAYFCTSLTAFLPHERHDPSLFLLRAEG